MAASVVVALRLGAGPTSGPAADPSPPPAAARPNTLDLRPGAGDLAADWDEAGGPNAVAFAPNARTLASGGADGAVRLWDLAGYGHGHAVTGLTSAANGRRLTTADKETGTVRVWGVAGGDEVLAFTTGRKRCHQLVWSPDGTRLAAAAFFSPVAV